jgi:hypothetical protein
VPSVRLPGQSDQRSWRRAGRLSRHGVSCRQSVAQHVFALLISSGCAMPLSDTPSNEAAVGHPCRRTSCARLRLPRRCGRLVDGRAESFTVTAFFTAAINRLPSPGAGSMPGQGARQRGPVGHLFRRCSQNVALRRHVRAHLPTRRQGMPSVTHAQLLRDASNTPTLMPSIGRLVKRNHPLSKPTGFSVATPASHAYFSDDGPRCHARFPRAPA